MIFAAKTKTINTSILLLAVLLLQASLLPVQQAQASTSQVVIFQLQTSAAGAAAQEYISIYNNSAQAVDISNWCMVYASASDSTQTQLACFKPSTFNTKLMLSGNVYLVMASNDFLDTQPDHTADFTFSGGISATSGHLKLLDSTKSEIDKIGWGAASNPEGSSVPAHPIGKILQRTTDTYGLLKDTDNNSADFTHASLIPLQPGSLYEEYSEPSPPAPGPLINEILPDVEGADTGKEFIEFYNPHSVPINLAGYVLQLGPAHSKSYTLPASTIEPGAYLSFSDKQTGLTLPNSSASVRLLSPNGDVISSTEAYDQPGEGVSWALLNGVWQLTHTPTPNAENILLETKPCPAGQVRSNETSCRKISAIASALIACKAGQTRSLETGRCRLIISTLTSALPCKPGQTRNPETKRCRSASTAADKKPCPAGQERNAQTGRCRKSAAGAAKMSGVKDVQTSLITNSAKWWVAGFAAVGSAGYAVYEWRREAWMVVEIIKARIIPS